MLKEISISKKYSFIVLLLIFIGLTILISISIYVQPLQGDLTRLGGYAERDFGWNIPRKVLSDDVHLAKSYDKYYDIVILGDSFSKSGLWQSFLTENTNFTFTTLHWDNATVEEIINNQIFKTSPPKLFIVEMGARSLPLRFSSAANAVCDPKKGTNFSNNWFSQFGDPHISFVEIHRETKTAWSEINLKFALMYLENSSLRWLFKDDFSKVKNYALNVNNLFSNRKSDEILLLSTWFDAKVWSDEEIAKAMCSISDIQNRVQSNGKTMFIILPIPDKGTAYEKYIINPKFSSMQELTSKLLNYNINTPRLDILIHKAIDNGEKDVYLPNDTHFGTKGYQLTAKSVTNFLVDMHVMGASTINTTN
jgi:hypothetical protein